MKCGHMLACLNYQNRRVFVNSPPPHPTPFMCLCLYLFLCLYPSPCLCTWSCSELYLDYFAQGGGGGQCWYSFFLFPGGGRHDTYKSVIVTLSDHWGGNCPSPKPLHPLSPQHPPLPSRLVRPYQCSCSCHNRVRVHIRVSIHYRVRVSVCIRIHCRVLVRVHDPVLVHVRVYVYVYVMFVFVFVCVCVCLCLCLCLCLCSCSCLRLRLRLRLRLWLLQVTVNFCGFQLMYFSLYNRNLFMFAIINSVPSRFANRCWLSSRIGSFVFWWQWLSFRREMLFGILWPCLYNW